MVGSSDAWTMHATCNDLYVFYHFHQQLLFSANYHTKLTKWNSDGEDELKEEKNELYIRVKAFDFSNMLIDNTRKSKKFHKRERFVKNPSKQKQILKRKWKSGYGKWCWKELRVKIFLHAREENSWWWKEKCLKITCFSPYHYITLYYISLNCHFFYINYQSLCLVACGSHGSLHVPSPLLSLLFSCCNLYWTDWSTTNGMVKMRRGRDLYSGEVK